MTGEPWSVDELIAAATKARDNAYVPYSRFAVGAAVRAASGRIYTGANVENASYGLTVCGERVALFNAAAAGERSIVGVAVVTGADLVTSPCGACRQVIVEFGRHVVVVGETLGGSRRSWTIEELLPDSFGPHSMESDPSAVRPIE